MKSKKKDKEKEILTNAVERHGEERQIIVAVEELSELTKELTKYLRGNSNFNEISEEMADVEIAIGELKIMFENEKSVTVWRKYKVDRLAERMNEKW